MKTWISKKTGKRYPDPGTTAGFTVKGNRVQIWEIGVGRYSQPLSQWAQEEIPDLTKNYTLAQFREYGAKYGILCAQEYMPCADIVKTAWAKLYMDTHYPDDEQVKWFVSVFKINPRDLADSKLAMALGHYSFDILAFEKHLMKWGYTLNSIISINYFMTQTFGAEVTARFEREYLGVN